MNADTLRAFAVGIATILLVLFGAGLVGAIETDGFTIPTNSTVER